MPQWRCTVLRKPRFAFLFVFLLACAAMLAWAVEPILDADGEAVGQVFVGSRFCSPTGVCTFPDGGGGGTTLTFRNPIVAKFFPADFHPNADPATGAFRRYGVVLFRGDTNTSGVLATVVAKVNPNDPGIVDLGAMLEILPPANNFFEGKAEAVLAVSALDPSGNGNGSLALVVSDVFPDHSPGAIVVVRNAWGSPVLDIIPGLTGPVSVAIDDTAQEVIVVEQMTTTAGACAVGQSPLRFFRLVDGTEARPTVCIDGVGDSADIEIDRGFGRTQAFISRSFSKGNISVIDLNNFTEFLPSPALYPPGDPAPAPGLDLDLAATGGRGYLAAPEFAGVKEFDLTSRNEIPPVIPADVYYHLRNGIATGVQEVSVSNFNNANTVRRGIVISRADPVNFPNRADQVTRVNLITRNNNRLGTSYQTTAVAFVPQRSTDQSNQQFFLRILVSSTDAVTLKLKKYDAGTVP